MTCVSWAYRNVFNIVDESNIVLGQQYVFKFVSDRMCVALGAFLSGDVLKSKTVMWPSSSPDDATRHAVAIPLLTEII